MALSSVPGLVRQNPKAAQNCQWVRSVGLEEQNGHSVQPTKFLAGGVDLSNNIQDYFGSTTLPALGSLLSGICWTGIRPPETLTEENDGTDDTGTKVTATVSATFDVQAVNTGPIALSQNSLSLTANRPSANLTVSLTQGMPWTVSIFPSNRTTRWLSAFPLSGTGTTTLSISADSTGLADGLYQATLVFQGSDALLQLIDVTVSFAVGNFLPPILNVGGGVSVGSYAGAGAAVAPGSVVAVFGQGFVTTSGYAGTLPLPRLLNGFSLTFNGISAPLVFVSGNQVNAQIAYEVTGSTAVVRASNPGGSSSSILINIAQGAPGIFSQSQNGSGAGAILDAITGAVITPNTPIARGRVISIFATGVGPVSNQPQTGAAATGSPTSQHTNALTVSLGNLQATPAFAGLAPGFAGLGQTNVQVPLNAPTGPAVPVMLTGSGVASNAVTLAIR